MNVLNYGKTTLPDFARSKNSVEPRAEDLQSISVAHCYASFERFIWEFSGGESPQASSYLSESKAVGKGLGRWAEMCLTLVTHIVHSRLFIAYCFVEWLQDQGDSQRRGSFHPQQLLFPTSKIPSAVQQSCCSGGGVLVALEATFPDHVCVEQKLKRDICSERAPFRPTERHLCFLSAISERCTPGRFSYVGMY